ncbi:glycosyltransferase family 4 protein [Thalassotalea sp. M1531]|uniref:Glycosyltransferase family 4 protein n=1 Tax=Thalassotalea algicola TaxID=2716224 RepID=A0A7Y0LA33_9GAMM|nr:glycosyltransferase family 4 protein [Thalassotalea algicola]NMP30449.1 glycosyltransferase family 4 protein [Thalassotalea algicola]
MMNILILLPFLKNTGPANVVVSLVNQLKAKNVKLHVVCLFSAENSYKEKISAPNVCVEELNGFKPKSLIKLHHYIRKHNIDVLHSHCLLADIVAPWLTLFYRTKTISTVHCSLKDNYKNEYSFPKGPIYYCLHQFSLALFNSVTYVSTSISNKSNANIIYNGVQARNISFKSSAANTINLIYAGRLISSKNIAWLVDSVRWLNSNSPFNFKLHLFGDGDLYDSVSQNNNTDIITYGFVNDYQSLVPENSIFINPSLFEGMPMAVIEALAANLPVVLSDIEPHQEIKEHIKEGVSNFTNEYSSLLTAIKKLISSKGEVIVDKAKMRKQFEQHFSDNQMAVKYYTAYSALSQ